MTPKEKADDLVKKHLTTISEETMDSENIIRYNAKQCAIVSVDEILNELDKLSSGDGYFEARFDFYSDVKIELKNI